MHFVQVGANDGVLDDPVHEIATELGWAGLLIEPVPHYFDKLTELHKNNPLIFLQNLGVSDAEGELEIHFLSKQAEGRFPDWTRGCASLDRARLAATLSAEGTVNDEDITCQTIAVKPLGAILEAQRFSQVDLLVIDVEGHEKEVLSSLDLTQVRPRLIVVEANSGPELDETLAHILETARYRCARIGDDIVAFSPAYPALDPTEVLNLIGFPKIA